jgi:hypothetical protein
VQFPPAKMRVSDKTGFLYYSTLNGYIMSIYCSNKWAEFVSRNSAMKIDAPTTMSPSQEPLSDVVGLPSPRSHARNPQAVDR